MSNLWQPEHCQEWSQRQGSPQYWCKDRGKRGVLEPKRGYTEEQKEQILSAYSERSSMRGIQRTFGVSRPTLASWLKKRREQSKT